MFAISNEELAKKKDAGKYKICKDCGKKHIIEFGKKKIEDGTYKEDKTFGFISCTNGKYYLVSINGKEI